MSEGRMCAICGQKTTAWFRRKIANNEVVCEDCFRNAKTLTFKQLLSTKKVTADEIKESIFGSLVEELPDFKPTQKIGSSIYFDENHEKILALEPIHKWRVLSYSDIEDFKLVQYGKTVLKGGIGRAIVGGALFGDAGAVIGFMTGRKEKYICTDIAIWITVKDVNQPVVYVPFLNKKTDNVGLAYLQAEECITALEQICSQQSAE